MASGPLAFARMTFRAALAQLPRFARWVLGVLALLSVGTVVLIVVAARFGPTKAGAWFTGIAVVVALAALIAGTLAAVFTLPGYLESAREQRAKAVVEMWLEVQGDKDTWSRGDDGDLVKVPEQTSYFVSVLISSTGDRPVHGATLNICVPSWCEIDPNDPPEKMHYKIPRIGPSSLIQPDEGIVSIRHTAA
jgi:hypothetical protein